MSGSSKFLSWVVLWVASLASAGAEPVAVHRLELSEPGSIQALEAAGPVTLWATENWALTLGPAAERSLHLLDRRSGEILFLLRTDESAPRIPAVLGRSVEVQPGIRLLTCLDAAALERLRPELDKARLDRPFAWRRPVTAVRHEDRIDWKPEVQALVDAVRPDRLMQDLEILEGFVTRYSYAPGCQEAGQWLADTMNVLGLDVTEHFHTGGMPPNIVGELVGTSLPQEIVIVCGHYDSISPDPYNLAPGADDNATGTAAMLQAARVMRRHGFARTLRFIGFSGEEQGLIGSQAYAADAAGAGEQIVAVLNFDMIGWVEPAPEDLECVGNTASTPLVDHFIECAGLYTGLPTSRRIDGSIWFSDHSAFWNQGYPAFLGIEDFPLEYPYYHTTQDTADKVDPAFFAESTRAAVAAAAEMAEVLTVPPPEVPAAGPAGLILLLVILAPLLARRSRSAPDRWTGLFS